MGPCESERVFCESFVSPCESDRGLGPPGVVVPARLGPPGVVVPASL